MQITSRDNRRIKEISKLLTSGRSRKENGLFVVEGVRICTDAADTGMEIVTLVYSDSAGEKYREAVTRIEGLAETVITVPDEIFEKLSDTKTPQGVLIVCRIPNLRLDIHSQKNGKFIALENLSDPANLGAVARTGEALGIDGLILSANCADPYSPKALRAGMGSMIRIPLIIADDFLALLGQMRENGYDIFAAVPDSSAMPLDKIKFGESSVVMIGNEGNGLTEEAKSFADERITIPMSGRAESLNAAVAASILIWEMIKPGAD